MMRSGGLCFTIIIVATFFVVLIEGTRVCVRKSFGQDRIVCVCNETYCDDFEEVRLEPAGSFAVYSSSMSGHRFQRFSGKFEKKKLRPFSRGNAIERLFEIPEQIVRAGINILAPVLNIFPIPIFGKIKVPTPEIKIFIDRKKRFQKIFGYGGAFTDAAGINIASLPKKAQQNLINSYFGPKGIGYTVGRVPIGGSDFSPRPYTYDDHPGDENLEKFELQKEDRLYKIPYIKMAKSVSRSEIRLYGSPWTAPPWMKTNNDYKGLGILKRKNYQTWANYFVKFLESYAEEGIKFWGVTTQNEPMDGLIPLFPFNCMGWTGGQLRKWIKGFLGPTIRNSSFPNLKIIIFDDNTVPLPIYANEILGDPEAAKYVWGIGLHWYLTSVSGFLPVNIATAKFPKAAILATEACNGFFPWETKVILGSWERGEAYATDILQGLKNRVVGWTDWNIALSMKGGPNWANLGADSPIIVNTAAKEFYKQPMFYALGHVAKFFLPDSNVIDVQVNSNSLLHTVITAGVARPDGSIAVAVLNKNDVDVILAITDSLVGQVRVNVPKRSMQTFVYA